MIPKIDTTISISSSENPCCGRRAGFLVFMLIPLPAVCEKSMSPVDRSVAPDPVADPEAVIVVDVPVQSESVGVGAPGGTLNIFSMSICEMTVELLCWRFLEFVPIASGIKAAIARTPTNSTTQAIIISIRDIPRWLDCDIRIMCLFRFVNSMTNHSSSQLWFFRPWLPLPLTNPLRQPAYPSDSKRNTSAPGCCKPEGWSNHKENLWACKRGCWCCRRNCLRLRYLPRGHTDWVVRRFRWERPRPGPPSRKTRRAARS